MLVVDLLALLGLYLADYDCGVNGFILLLRQCSSHLRSVLLV